MSEGNGKRTSILAFFGNTKAERVTSIVAIVLSLILIPVLILNCILILQTVFNPDEVPSIGKHTPLIVLTESMELEILAGDLIVTKVTPTDEIELGDVISYFDPASKSDSVVTHRVIAITELDGALAFRTQGDNNDIEDRHPVPAEKVIGVWTGFRVRYLGNVMLFMQSAPGLILCVALPVAAVIVLEVIKRRRADGKKQDDIDALLLELAELKAKQGEEKTPDTDSHTEH